MPFEVKCAPDLRAIELRLWQRLSVSDLQLLLSEVAKLAGERGYRRALADCRDYLGGISIGEVFFLAKELSDRPADERGAEAIITPNDPSTRADVQCYVDTAAQFGTNARMFDSREAAVEWLESGQ